MLAKFGTEASQAQQVEERASTDYLSESMVERRPPHDDFSSSHGERWWRRTDKKEERSFSYGERLKDTFPKSKEACEKREIHGVQDPRRKLESYLVCFD